MNRRQGAYGAWVPEGIPPQLARVGVRFAPRLRLWGQSVWGAPRLRPRLSPQAPSSLCSVALSESSLSFPPLSVPLVATDPDHSIT